MGSRPSKPAAPGPSSSSSVIMRTTTSFMAPGATSIPVIRTTTTTSSISRNPTSVPVISPDNTCGLTGVGGSASGFTCPNELPCCSEHGFCGSSFLYCGTGCNSAYGVCNVTIPGTPTPPGGSLDDPDRCGPGVGSCASTKCCSIEGFCGTTKEHCQAPDCQFNFGPRCDANSIPTGTNTSSIGRPKIGSILYGSSGIYDCQVAGDMALTFDDGPYIYTSGILDLMKTYGAKATFFVTGNNNGKGEIDNSTLEWPGLIKRMYNEGHQIASHTWSHADLCAITSAQRKDEMWKLEMAVRNIVGVVPTYMRPPYSSCTAECGCEADMEALGYHITYFDLDTSDYLNTLPSTIQNAVNIFDKAITGKSPATDDFLVIAHDIHQQTAEVLVEHMLKAIKEKGYRAVTVGECLGDPKENWYRVDAGATLGLG